MATDNRDILALALPARVWATIDAEVDTVVSLAALDLDQALVDQGAAIRQAGWDQVPWVNGDWPPFDQQITIALTRAQWLLAVSHLQRSQPIYQELGGHESVELGRTALAILTDQLDQDRRP